MSRKTNSFLDREYIKIKKDLKSCEKIGILYRVALLPCILFDKEGTLWK